PLELRAGGRRVDLVLLPDSLALRRAAWTRLPAEGGSSTRRTDLRSGRAGRGQTPEGRPLATGTQPPGTGSRRDGRGRRQAQQVEHATRTEGTRLVREAGALAFAKLPACR